jgi:thiol-disulfide isomerase/thioredoxin
MTKFVNFNQGPSLQDNNSFLSKLNIFKGGAGLNSTTILYIVIAICIFLLLIYLYYQYVKPVFNTRFTANNELGHESGQGSSGQGSSGQGSSGQGSSSKDAELMLFYVDWCPHCKTAKPIWDELKTEYENKKINGYTILFSEINCTNETPEIESLINKFKIEGYPTIKLLKDGNIVEYDAKPNKATLIEFLNTAL